MKKAILLMSILIIVFTGFAESMRAWDNKINPGLLSFRTRGFLEVGADVKTSTYIPDIFTLPKTNYNSEKEMLTDLLAWLNGQSFTGNLYLDVSTFGVIHLGTLGLGFRENVSGLSENEIPYELFNYYAGNVTPTNNMNLGTVTGNTYLEISEGLYAALRSNTGTLSAVYNLYTPIAYKSSGITLEASPDQNNVQNKGLILTAKGSYLTGLPYTANQFSDGPLFRNIDNPSIGQKLDVGFVSGNHRRPDFGIALTDFVLVPSMVSKKVNFTAVSTVTTADNNNNNYSEEPKKENTPAISVSNIQSMKFEPYSKFTAFVRIPFGFDFIPYIEYYPEAEGFVYNWGVNSVLDLAIFKLSAGLSQYHPVMLKDNGDPAIAEMRNIKMWRANLDLGFNIYFVEFTGGLGLNTKEEDIKKLIKPEGITANLSVAFGF